jgi:putative chitinase
MLSLDQLREIVPGGRNLDIYHPLLVEIMPDYKIDTPIKVAAFIAQIAHESGSFRYVREIASGQAYEGRKDLGNINKGDGVKFKGRGLIQTTGRAEYLATSIILFGDDRLIHNPEILTVPRYAVESACLFWMKKGLNEVAAQPDDWTTTVTIRRRNGTKEKRTYNKIQYITLRINGGQNGISERTMFFNRARKVLSC